MALTPIVIAKPTTTPSTEKPPVCDEKRFRPTITVQTAQWNK